MKWVGISGSRLTNRQVEEDVRREVKVVLDRGDGIITGGALGVDYVASDEVVKRGLAKDTLRICLPVTLNVYSKHYRERAKEGVITNDEADKLITQLEHIRAVDAECLLENSVNTEVNQKTYFERNGKVVELSDELLAFQVNNSPGTQDTINQAKIKGIPVRVFTYTI